MLAPNQDAILSANAPLDVSALVNAIVDRVMERLTVTVPHVPCGTPVGAAPATTAPTGEWLTAAEAARYLGMKPKALYTAVERRQIPASRLGRRLRFHRAGLDALLRGRAGKMRGRVPSPGESERWSS